MRYDDEGDQLVALVTQEFGERLANDTIPPNGKALRTLRNGMTQTALSKLTGVRQSTISRMENKEVNEKGEVCPYETIAFMSLALALNCSLSEIAVLPKYVETTIDSDTLAEIQPRLLKVSMVRTLFSPRNKMDLREFYYRTILIEVFETHVGEAQEEALPIEVETADSLACGVTVVQGIAGQGKSIFLRYLAASIAEAAVCLPVFIELRHTNSKRLWDLICDHLYKLGIEKARSQLETLLRSGQIVLLLDAFDEVPGVERGDVLNDIRKLSDANPKLKIIITSRPDAIVSGYQKRYQIRPLIYSEIPEVVRRYATEDESKVLLRRVETGLAEKLGGVLRSPLMVLLLVLHFRYTSSIPNSTIGFYKDLFDVLVRRHNMSESGPKRELTSKLNPYQLRVAFGAISFVLEKTLTDDDIRVSDLEDAANDALTRLNFNADPRFVLDDIVYVSNLILDEGNSFRFIHKSVKEFYAASFVASLPDIAAKKFYSQILQSWSRWEGELSFLAHLDTYRYTKYFLLPDIELLQPFNAKTMLKQIDRIELTGKDGKLSARFIGFNRMCGLGDATLHGGNLRVSDFVETKHVKTAREMLRKHKRCVVHRKRASDSSVDEYLAESVEIFGWDSSLVARQVAMFIKPSRFSNDLKRIQATVDDLENSALDFID